MIFVDFPIENSQQRDNNQQIAQQRHSGGPNRSVGSRSGHEQRSQRRRTEGRTQLRDFVPRSPK